MTYAKSRLERRAQEQELGTLERKIENAQRALAYEQDKLAALRDQCQREAALAAGEADRIKNNAAEEAQRLIGEAQAKWQAAEAAVSDARGKANEIIAEAQAEAARVETGDAKDLTDLAIALRFLRKEAAKAEAVRDDLLTEVNSLTATKQRLEHSLDVLRKRFDGLKRELEQ